MATERRYVEIRQSGRTLSGVAIRYGDTAIFPWGRERFEPGAFGDVSLADVILNTQHDRQTPLARTGGAGLTLLDSSAALEIRADLPDTQPANDVLALVKRGVLRGLSIEFKATSERMEQDLRIVEQADLAGVSVVDTGAYPGSTVEARQKNTKAFRGSIPYNKTLACKCHRGTCKQVTIARNAFDESLQDDSVEILAIHGDYSRALASRKRGTLRMTSTDDGLQIEFDLPDTTTGNDLVAANTSVPLVMRPVFDQDLSEFAESGEVASYSKMKLRAVLLGATDNDAGWPEAELVDTGKPRPRRVRRWL